MKKMSYGKIKSLLGNTYFKPDDESKKRLFKKLQIIHGEDLKEKRFVTRFRIALVAVILFICLLNINSVNQQSLNRYNSENIIALGKLFNASSLLEKLIAGMED